MCPAGIRPHHSAQGPSRTAEPLWPAPWGQDPSTQRRSSCRVLRQRGCAGIPALSTALPALSPPTEKPQEPRGTLAPSTSLPSKLQHHTIVHHRCPLRGALPVPCQTPHAHGHIHPTALLWDQPAPLRKTASTCRPQGTLHVPQPKGCACARYSWGRQDTWKGAVREGWTPDTSRDQPCSTRKPWEHGITAWLQAVVLHKKKQSDEVFQPPKWLVLSDSEKPLRFSPSRGRGRIPALKQGAIIKPWALKSFCSLDVPEQGSEDT